MPRSKAALFWPVFAAITLSDVLTKAWAVTLPERLPHEVLGDWMRFTLVYNPGAAFGLDVGPQSRWIFMALTIIALAILARLYRGTTRGETVRILALSMVCAGAAGNLLDRIRSFRGVVDFIDIGFGDARWPTFNIADVAVSVGAFLLAWVLWDEDRGDVPAAAPVAAPATAASDPGEAS